MPRYATPVGGMSRTRGKAGPALKGKTASKRKPTKTHPGHARTSTTGQFKEDNWHAVAKETSGKAPRAVQANHPPKSPKPKGKPTDSAARPSGPAEARHAPRGWTRSAGPAAWCVFALELDQTGPAATPSVR